jgi:hypothetical protein
MEPTQVTITSEVKTQTPGKFPEESTLESQHGKSLKTYEIGLTPGGSSTVHFYKQSPGLRIQLISKASHYWFKWYQQLISTTDRNFLCTDLPFINWSN